MKKHISWHLGVIALFSFVVFALYLFYVNFSTDTIILFLSQKLYLGKWLAKGIFPFFNPNIFIGIPFGFDVGMGNFHPFNLFFLLPYPFSFALFNATAAFMMLFGFYLLFMQFSKNKTVSLLFSLMFFFSGSGFWRTNNQTIYLVIAHYGLFFASFRTLQKKDVFWSPWTIILGVLMTLAGHIQFVLYGYLIGVIVAYFFQKISPKKIFMHFLTIGLLTSWYYILSLPLVINSTRMTTHKQYANMGPLSIIQLGQLVFPLFLGYVENGSKWNAGPTFVILISVLFMPFLAVMTWNKRIKPYMGLVLAVFMAATLGIVNFPFFRGAAQSFIVIHVIGLCLFSQFHNDIVIFLEDKRLKYVAIFGFVVSLLAFGFFFSPVFSSLFSAFYHMVKKTPSLFFDTQTITAIGRLIGMNFVIYLLLSVTILAIQFNKKMLLVSLTAFVILEGLYINYLHNFFVPESIISNMTMMPVSTNTRDYRIQTGADVIPYFGFHNYMSNVLFRPPFSKEITMFDATERKTLDRLKNTMGFYPSTWGMVYGFQMVQAYNTFVPRSIATYFRAPSSDYTKEYAYIIQRNNLFGQSEIGLDINGIETSRITLNDPRWQMLGVRYFISDRPLAKYKLIASDSGRLFYENPNSLPIYRIEKEGKITGLTPVYSDPNRWEFDISKDMAGGTFTMVMNPGGFVAKLDGREIPLTKHDLTMEARLAVSGRLVVSYSPIRHLIETLKQLPHIL